MRSPWQYRFYWSSSPNASNSGYAWDVNFNNGHVYNGSKLNGLHVRLVRAGQ
ncbi:DUF1566 domain-containing protein [Vibrio navarrensis]|uniref:Lcl C-terminal domain-containing protein n=1 Tax=Vibrio navarrensis TaxID=29495 RepID=UPI00192F5519|nr:DUF1566 domain-containing protein [Vibrio navarrensis]